MEYGESSRYGSAIDQESLKLSRKQVDPVMQMYDLKDHLPPERSPPQGVPVGSPGSSLISILNWTKIHCHFHLHQLSFSLKLGSQRAFDLSRVSRDGDCFPCPEFRIRTKTRSCPHSLGEANSHD